MTAKTQTIGMELNLEIQMVTFAASTIKMKIGADYTIRPLSIVKLCAALVVVAIGVTEIPGQRR